MSAIDHVHCPWSDAVVAHFLDGAVEDGGFEQRETLREHREDCATCQAALLRARRLDALVAATAEHRVAERRAEAWLDAALTTADAEPAKTPSRSAVPLVLAIGVLAIGVAVGVAWERGAGTERPIEPRAETPEVAIAEFDGTIRLPAGGSRRSLLARPAPRIEPALAAARVVALDELWWFALPAVACRGGTVAEAQAVAEGLRRNAARALVEESSAIDLLIELCASLPDDTRLAALVEVARTSDAVTGRLARDLDVDRSVAAAARIGGPRLDRALARHAGADAGSVHAIAAELAKLEQRPGRARLLIAVWSAFAARHDVIDDLAFAQQLWLRASDADVDALCDMLRTSRVAAERERVLWSLAVLRSPAAASALTDRLGSVSRSEAVLAAFALSRVPVTDVDPPRRGAMHRALWLVARTSGGDPVARTVVERLQARGHDFHLLLAGDLSCAQIDAASRLLARVGWQVD